MDHRTNIVPFPFGRVPYSPNSALSIFVNVMGFGGSSYELLRVSTFTLGSLLAGTVSKMTSMLDQLG